MAAVTIVAIWLDSLEKREMTLTLQDADGRRLLAVVPIDRMTDWMKPGYTIRCACPKAQS